MRLLVLILAVAPIVPAAGTAAADDAVINTPVVLASLQGDWEIQPVEPGAYRQRLRISGSTAGQWHQSARALPVSITFYVEGNELLIQHYYEPDRPFNYRIKQLRFGYELNGDVLTLVGPQEKTVWRRVARRRPAERAPGDDADGGADGGEKGFSLREVRVTDSRSVFGIETSSGDGQLGIAVAVEIAKLADQRGFRYFTGRPILDGSEVEFFKEHPGRGAENDPFVFDVQMLTRLQAPQRERSDR
jgi:hypothetical protein